MPNVGKSSVLFNLLRGSGRRLRAKPEVKDIPGFTKKVTEYLLRAKPKAICIDVPGITPPPDFLMERPQSWYGLVGRTPGTPLAFVVTQIGCEWGCCPLFFFKNFKNFIQKFFSFF